MAVTDVLEAQIAAAVEAAVIVEAEVGLMFGDPQSGTQRLLVETYAAVRLLLSAARELAVAMPDSGDGWRRARKDAVSGLARVLAVEQGCAAIFGRTPEP